MTIGLLAIALAALLPSASAQEPSPQPTPAPQRPNVLLVVLDDLYYKVGLYGHPVRTPNLERLAQRGRRFDRAYNQYPICNPSRISLMTGWRPERTRVWSNGDSPAATLQGATPMQDHFRAHGYFTARVGKLYHTPFESEFKWDLAVDPAEAPVEGDEDDFESKLRATANADAEEPDGRSARRAAELLEAKRERPLFLAVGFLRPHGPWIAPKAYFELYPPRAVVLPRVPKDDLADVPRVALKRGAEPIIPEQKKQEALAAYYACISFADAQIGVLLDALDRGQLWDSTIVVVTSDHGIQRGEHGLWRKNMLFEESARVPLVVAAPGLRQPGTPTTSLVELVDLYPTLTELAAIPRPEKLDGVSLVPLLDDPARVVRTAAFTVSSRGRQLGVSMRTERYRYTQWRDDAAELYDHATDPDEIHNLSRDPSRRGLVEELKARLLAGPLAAIPTH